MDDSFGTVILNHATGLFLEVSDRAPDELEPEAMTAAEVLRSPHVRRYEDQKHAAAVYFAEDEDPNAVA